MLKIRELSQRIAEYKDAVLSLDDFEDWFRDHSRGSYGAGDARVNDAIVAVESALSKFHFQGISEPRLGQELAAAIRPFSEAPEMVRAQSRTVAVFHGGFPLIDVGLVRPPRAF